MKDRASLTHRRTGMFVLLALSAAPITVSSATTGMTWSVGQKLACPQIPPDSNAPAIARDVGEESQSVTETWSLLAGVPLTGFVRIVTRISRGRSLRSARSHSGDPPPVSPPPRGVPFEILPTLGDPASRSTRFFCAGSSTRWRPPITRMFSRSRIVGRSGHTGVMVGSFPSPDRSGS